MKTKLFAAGVLLAALCAPGQGTFLYDQQSSSNEGNYGYGTGPTYQSLVPSTGQSFTPNFSAIDFIRLDLSDGNITDGLGSTWFLNLRSDSITGPILGTTAPVGLPDTFIGTANFFFPSTVPLTPGTTYYFDVNSTDGGGWHMIFGQFSYPGGIAWARGQPNAQGDYWFREGIIVPEPSSVALLLLGGAALACLRRRGHE